MSLVKDHIQVSLDGSTVWVFSDDGSTTGRFSKRFGMDVHNTVTDQIKGASECLHCTHQAAGPQEWEMFRRLIKENFSIDVPQDVITF